MFWGKYTLITIYLILQTTPANFRDSFLDTYFRRSFFFIVHVRKRLTLALYRNNDIGSFLLLFQLKSEIKANKVQDLMNQC